jgi:molybdopterin-guanine dinucleotide biosynthesis protein B
MVGKSGVGKTTTLERVLGEIKCRGYKVGTIKHDRHGFDIDKPGKDTWRHAEAGSDAVAISGPRKMAIIRNLEEEMPLDDIVQMMGPVDLVITEGYKLGDKPKIEVTRRERGTEMLCQPDELIAVMSDYPLSIPVPQFALEDAVGIVDLLEELYLRPLEEA